MIANDSLQVLHQTDIGSGLCQPIQTGFEILSQTLRKVRIQLLNRADHLVNQTVDVAHLAFGDFPIATHPARRALLEGAPDERQRHADRVDRIKTWLRQRNTLGFEDLYQLGPDPGNVILNDSYLRR